MKSILKVRIANYSDKFSLGSKAKNIKIVSGQTFIQFRPVKKGPRSSMQNYFEEGLMPLPNLSKNILSRPAFGYGLCLKPSH
jgi:hypothetical protein